MFAVTIAVPSVASAALGDWLLFVLCVGLLLFVAEVTAPKLRTFITTLGVALLIGGVLLAQDAMVKPFDICTIAEPWSITWILNFCWM